MRRLQGGDEGISPTLHIEAANALHETLPAPHAFLSFHGERPIEAFGQLFAAEGVDDHRLGHLPGRAGEARENEHARVIGILGGDIFLGDEIHAVAKRRDQTDLCGAVHPGQFVPPIIALDVVDGRPIHVGIGADDASAQRVDAGAQILVRLDLLA